MSLKTNDHACGCDTDSSQAKSLAAARNALDESTFRIRRITAENEVLEKTCCLLERKIVHSDPRINAMEHTLEAGNKAAVDTAWLEAQVEGHWRRCEKICRN